MKVRLWHVFLAGAIAAGIVGGASILHFKNLRIEAEKTRAEQEAQNRKDREVKAAFEDLLNSFLREVERNALEYRQRRQILSGLVKPENLGKPEYAEENASLAESTILALNIQMDEIMNAFAKADEEISALTQELSEEERLAAAQKWAEVRKKQRDMFAAYFASERDIIGAYKELIDFYAVKRDGMSVDVANGKIRFSSPEDQEKAEEIKRRIEALNSAQAELLQSAGP